MSYPKQFALLGGIIGFLAPGSLFAYGLISGRPLDSLTVFAVMTTAGVLTLCAAGAMIGHREQLLIEKDTRLGELRTQLQQQTVVDDLTGVANRKAFDTELVKEVARAQRYRMNLSLVMIDLDHFKKLSETYGSDMGDRALAFVARALLRHKRKGDWVARYGGDEFAVILPHTGAEDAARWAERTRSALSLSGAETEAGLLSVTASFGVASFAGDPSPEKLLMAADRALYAAKQSGRNCVFPLPRNAGPAAPPS